MFPDAFPAITEAQYGKKGISEKFYEYLTEKRSVDDIKVKTFHAFSAGSACGVNISISNVGILNEVFTHLLQAPQRTEMMTHVEKHYFKWVCIHALLVCTCNPIKVLHLVLTPLLFLVAKKTVQQMK